MGTDGTPTTEERIARQEYDDGDPDDPVVIKTTRTGGRRLFYHEHPMCPWVRTAKYPYVQKTRGWAQRSWKAPCKVCTVPELHEAPSQQWTPPGPPTDEAFASVAQNRDG